MGNPDFWRLPRITRFWRFGLRLAAVVPTALKYGQMDLVERENCLLSLLQLGLSCANTLDTWLVSHDVMEASTDTVEEFGIQIASIVGDMASARASSVFVG